jgi:L-ascorbate metabolism protein UlaG (beta-lactamase superfamily)
VETTVCFRWLGVAGSALCAGNRILAIDPFFSRPPFWRLWFGRVPPQRALVPIHLPRCDHVLVTHSHYDHVMDVPDVVRHTGAIAYGSANTCHLLEISGVPEGQFQQIDTGDELKLGPFQVRVLPAEHRRVLGFSAGPLRRDLMPPLRLRDYRMDRCFGFHIEVGTASILHWPSVRPERAPPAEVLVARPEGRDHLASLLAQVQPRLIIPVHWDDLFQPLSRPVRPFYELSHRGWPPLRRVDLDQFAVMVEELAPRTGVLVPEILSVYDLVPSR